MLEGLQDWVTSVDWGNPLIVAVVVWALTTSANERARRRESSERLEARSHDERTERQRRLDDLEAARVQVAEERSAAAAADAIVLLESFVRVETETWEEPGEYETSLDEAFTKLWRLRERVRDEQARDVLELVVDVHNNLGEVAYRSQMGGSRWVMQQTCMYAIEVLGAVLRVQAPPDEPVGVAPYREIVEQIRAKEEHEEQRHAQKHAARRAADPSTWPRQSTE